MDAINHIIRHKLVPVFYHDDTQWCLHVMATCYKAGIRVFEFTNRGTMALANFSALYQFQKENCPEMILGAGTVLHQKAATNFIKAGAAFIVSPCFSNEVMEECKKNKIHYMPGCMTVKEIYDADATGCKMVKLFPGEVVGVAFVKAAKAVLPTISMMVTGGVNNENISNWFKAGVDAAGLGSDYFKSEDIGTESLLIIEEKIRAVRRLLG